MQAYWYVGTDVLLAFWHSGDTSANDALRPAASQAPGECGGLVPGTADGSSGQPANSRLAHGVGMDALVAAHLDDAVTPQPPHSGATDSSDADADFAAGAGSDAAGFEEFVRATRHRLRSHLIALTSGRRLDVVDDLLAETYARAWQRWPQLRSYAHPQAWLHTVARRLAGARWRTGSRRADLLTRWAPDLARGVAVDVGTDVHTGPPGSYLSDDAALDRLLVAAAMRALPSEQQRVLRAYYWAGLPVRDIAETLGVPAGTVKARLFRARAALAVVLRDREADLLAA